MNREETLLACGLSKDFFFRNFYHIPVVGVGAQLFEMRDYQRFVADRIEAPGQAGTKKLINGLKARQIGWTTIGVANAFWDALFHEEHPWLLVSRNEDAAQKMLQKAVYAYYRLPEWMKRALPKVTTQTQSVLEFANGSRIESVPATGSTGRGDAVYGSLMDECAFMEYAEDIWGAIEPLTYGVAMIFSTANGMGNFFHEVWLDSQQEDSRWEGIFFPWSVVETRGEDWYNATKRAFRGREWLFYQEYPSTAEEAFAKSGRVAFASDIVQSCFVPVEPSIRYEWVIGQGVKEISVGEDVDVPIDIWVPPHVVRDEFLRPVWQPNYVVGVDVAEGLEHGDYTAFTVFDVNTGEEAASGLSHMPVSYLNELLDWLGRYYMNALMVVERNAAGVLPIDRLFRDNWYPRMYRMDRFAARRTGDRTPEYGWRTHVGTKHKMVDDFDYALREGHVLLHDPRFPIEAQTFISDGKGGFGATARNHDDTIMSKLIAWQGVLDSEKYQIIWRDSVILPPTHDEVDALIFGGESYSTADRLETPVGNKGVQKSKKTVLFLDENFTRNGLKNTE